jgi:hypothetical protein
MRYAGPEGDGKGIGIGKKWDQGQDKTRLNRTGTVREQDYNVTGTGTVLEEYGNRTGTGREQDGSRTRRGCGHYAALTKRYNEIFSNF